MESATSKVLQGNIPHILEIIFLKLDYEAFKTCFEVSKDWREILKSKSFLERAKLQFAAEITMDQEKLVKACREGDIEKINGLLSTDLLNINQMEYNSAPLIEATFWGKVNAVKLLLQRGADPNIMDDYGYTALLLIIHHANDFNQGQIDVVHALLDGGADPNVTNDDEETPISLALSWMSFDHKLAYLYNLQLAFIKALIDAGAKLTDKDKQKLNKLPSEMAKKLKEVEKQKKEAEKQEKELISAHGLMDSISHYL